MDERNPYVGPTAARAAPGTSIAVLAGVLLAAGVVAVVAWGVTRAIGGGEEAAPPPTTASAAPAKPTLRIVSRRASRARRWRCGSAR